jgi:hypothetical protein
MIESLTQFFGTLRSGWKARTEEHPVPKKKPRKRIVRKKAQKH